MNEPTIADDVLDFSDIVLITMSSATTSGRVMAASICACGNIATPPPRRERVAVAPAATLGERIRRRVIGVLQGLRAS